MKSKHPDSHLIDCLGGTASVARMFGISQPSVTKWRFSGIPDARRMCLQLVRPDLFGQSKLVSKRPELAEKEHV